MSKPNRKFLLIDIDNLPYILSSNNRSDNKFYVNLEYLRKEAEIKFLIFSSLSIGKSICLLYADYLMLINFLFDLLQN